MVLSKNLSLLPTKAALLPNSPSIASGRIDVGF